MKERLRDDSGTVLLLIIGLTVVVALLVAVITDVTALYLQRRELISAADGAALAGAQAVNERQIYANGLPKAGPVPLDRINAEAAARQYLEDVGLSGQLDVRVESTSTTVTVRVDVAYHLPAASRVSLGLAGSVPVTASATARTAVIR